jgi:hypothetical protein
MMDPYGNSWLIDVKNKRPIGNRPDGKPFNEDFSLSKILIRRLALNG